VNTEAANAFPLPSRWESFRIAETPAEYVFHRPRVYLETTIASYLTARPSRDLKKARLQWITSRWWNSWRTQFEIYVSDVVIEEARNGDPEAAERRLELLEPFPRLEKNLRCVDLATRLMDGCVLPPNARDDAEHIAIASIHRMEYLLSWNCAHLVNEHMAKNIGALCQSEGYSCPILCTPKQLMERYEHGPLP
jgi:hypothetical protein